MISVPTALRLFDSLDFFIHNQHSQAVPFFALANHRRFPCIRKLKMFATMIVVVIIIVCLCVLVSILNIALVGKEMMLAGVKARVWTLFYMITYLFSMVIFLVRAVYRGYDGPIAFALMFLPTFLFNIALGGICLLSLIKFDKVLPHAVDAKHAVKMKVLYASHALLTLITLAFPFVLYFMNVDDTLSLYVVTVFRIWVVILEISISYSFLRSLLKGRQNLTSTTKANKEKLVVLNSMVLYIRASYGIIFALFCTYLGCGALIASKMISQDLADACGCLCVALYLTIYCHQKRIISKIYK